MQSEEAAVIAKDFWRSWAARSPTAKRELADALMRGTADDIVKVLAKHDFITFFNAIPDEMLVMLRSDPELLMAHFRTVFGINVPS